jgi:hypothetical protein
MSKFTGFSFPCQRCRGKFYELTDKFVPTPPMRGDYVALLPKYGPGGYNWYDFPHTQWTIGDNVACVQCGEPIRIEYVYEFFKVQIQQVHEHGNEVGQKSSQKGQTAESVGEGATVYGDAVSSDTVADGGLYDAIDVEDSLLQTVLRMTTSGETQAAIAEACGVSIYRVRKIQNGEIE